MMLVIQNLREVQRRCLAGEPLDQDLAGWLGEALEKFLCHECRSIEDALGLRFAQGGVPWWLEEAIRTRDSALRMLAHHFLGDCSTTAKAREIRTLSMRYAASSWRFDRVEDAMPSRYPDTPLEWLWRAFKSGAAMPIGERQLRSILSD